MIRKILITVVLISLLGVLCAGGYYLYKNSGMQNIKESVQKILSNNSTVEELLQMPSENVFSSFLKKFSAPKVTLNNPFKNLSKMNLPEAPIITLNNPLKNKAKGCKSFFKGSRKTTFTFWTIQLKAPAGRFIEDNIETFKKQYPDIEIVWVDIPIAEAQKRTLASVLSGNPPDLINLNPDFSSLLAQKGILEYFTEEETNEFHPELIDKLRYNGNIFALPFYATSPVTVYNEKTLNKCFENKYPVVSSYEDVYEISKEIKNCTDRPSIVLNLNENDTFAKILNKYYISDFEDDTELVTLNHIVSMFNDMYKKGYLPKDTLTLNHREMIEQYMAGNAVFIVAGSNFIKMIKENAPDIYAQSEITNQLTSPDGKYDVGLMNFVIPKNARNKELAKEFAFLLTNKENQLKFAKLTNTLPSNLEVLLDDYFIDCPDDLCEKSRCIGASQLNSLVKKDFGYKNKKAINDTLNRSLEEILLNNKISEDKLEIKLKKLQNEIRALMKD